MEKQKKTFLISFIDLILRFAIVQNKFQQTNKTKINHINDNHIKFEVSLHFGGSGLLCLLELPPPACTLYRCVQCIFHILSKFLHTILMEIINSIHYKIYCKFHINPLAWLQWIQGMYVHLCKYIKGQFFEKVQMKFR